MVRNDRTGRGSSRSGESGYDLSEAYDYDERRRNRRTRRSLQGSASSARARSERAERARARRSRNTAESASTVVAAENTASTGTLVQANAAAQDGAAATNPYSRSSAQSRYHARPQKGHRVRNIVIAVIAVLLVGCGTAGALWYNTIASNLAGDHDINNLTAAVEGEPYYVLLLGGDSRADSQEDNRTDSIMVARIDEENKDVSLLSVPRDLRVYIDGYGYAKINSAIEHGGYDAVINEVNQVLDIKISYYAFIYFSGFKDLVDKLGGVEVDVPEGTYYNGTWVPAGDNVHIDGTEALVLARCRHGYPADTGAYAMGDYQRTLNQRNLIKAIAKKVLEQDAATLASLITDISECVETNMSPASIVTAATNLKGMKVNKIESLQLPVAGVTTAGADGITAWYAVMYEDVYKVVLDNFKNGRSLTEGIDGFNSELNDNDVGSDFVDGEVYAYTQYADKYGDFAG